MSNTLHLRHGDCLVRLQELDENSIGAIVCDPPYELSFMGKGWDGTGIVYNPELWAHLYRVLVPGGVVKAFSATRTFHRMAAAMQQAGFTDIRIEAWSYGSGFPKSKNIGLFLDKALGATGDRGRAIPMASTHFPGEGRYGAKGGEKLTSNPVPPYSPVTPEARTWAGFGTALKPSWEPVLVGTKPA